MVPIPTTDNTIDVPNFSIVHANVDCQLQFTRYVHVCENRTSFYQGMSQMTWEPTAINFLKTTSGISRPYLYCPDDGRAWNVFIVYKSNLRLESRIRCAHLDVNGTYKAYKRYCTKSIKTNTSYSIFSEHLQNIWRHHIGIPNAFEASHFMNTMRMVKMKTPYQIMYAEPKARSSPCPSGMFSCDNGTCILDTQLCDGNGNCVDKSDELHENCEAVCIVLGVKKHVSIIHVHKGRLHTLIINAHRIIFIFDFFQNDKIGLRIQLK